MRSSAVPCFLKLVFSRQVRSLASTNYYWLPSLWKHLKSSLNRCVLCLGLDRVVDDHATRRLFHRRPMGDWSRKRSLTCLPKRRWNRNRCRKLSPLAWPALRTLTMLPVDRLRIWIFDRSKISLRALFRLALLFPVWQPVLLRASGPAKPRGRPIVRRMDSCLQSRSCGSVLYVLLSRSAAVCGFRASHDDRGSLASVTPVANGLLITPVSLPAPANLDRQ